MLAFQEIGFERFLEIWKERDGNKHTFLDKLKKWVFRTVVPTCAASLELEFMVEIWLLQVCFTGITLEDAHGNWLSWLLFLFLGDGLLIY